MQDIKWLAQEMGTLLELLEQPVTIVDQQGRFVYFSSESAKMDGVTPEEAIGKHILEVSPWLDPEESTMLRCLKEGSSFLDTYQAYVGPAGQRIHFIHSVLPIYARDSKTIVGAIEIGRTTRQAPHQEKKENIPVITGKHPLLLEQIYLADTFAKRTIPVLIYGETGTGKELFARRVHALSERSDKPMLCVNCAAIPESLLESSLFGTRRGAFTGAENKKGLFSLADGGTLFLDEINSMPIGLQTKLLRVLQDGTFLPLGAEKSIKVNVRLIAALNQEPLVAVQEGKLREDLYYRLNVGSVFIPPLRLRKSDIGLLAQEFVNLYAPELNPAITAISELGLQHLTEHDWMGNVRELENLIQRSLLLSQEKGELTHLYFGEGNEYKPRSISSISSISSIREGSLRRQLADFERETIDSMMKAKKGNVSAVARALNIPRTTLLTKIQKLNLREKETR